MANTYAIYEGNGITKTFAIPVTDWASDSHIIVQIATGGARYDSTTVGTYSFSISGTNIVFDVAPASGIVFVVMRDTLGKDRDDIALDYDFEDGSGLTADQVDGAYRHALYQAQEAVDRVPVYDSGWQTSIEGTALAANTTFTVSLTEDIFDSLPWRDVRVFGRNSGTPTQFYPIPTSFIVEETAGGTQFSVGIRWIAVDLDPVWYISMTTGDYATLQTDAPTVLDWVTSVDEIRVIVT